MRPDPLKLFTEFLIRSIRTANIFRNRNIDIISKETSLRLLDET